MINNYLSLYAYIPTNSQILSANIKKSTSISKIYYVRQLHRFILLIIIISIVTLFSFIKPNESIPDSEIDIYTIERSLIYNNSIDDFTRCILDMHEALNRLSIPWFLTHGTALNYWRSKNFIANDMDIGVFYE